MTDANNNGIVDAVEKDAVLIHWRSAVAGAVTALLIGGTSLTIMAKLFPQTAFVAEVFAGTACESVRKDLEIHKKAVVCYHTAATILEIDDSQCQALFDE